MSCETERIWLYFFLAEVFCFSYAFILLSILLETISRPTFALIPILSATVPLQQTIFTFLLRTPFAMTPVAESLNVVKEITLRVVLPLFGDNNTKIIKSSSCSYNSVWTLTLTRSGEMLTIDVLWNRASHQDYTFYNSMLVFARGEYDRGEKVSSTSTMFMTGERPKGRAEAMRRVVISHVYVL